MSTLKLKGCKSRAPRHEDLRCELVRGHDVNPRSLHKAGYIVWNNEGEHKHHRTLSELILDTPGQDRIPLLWPNDQASVAPIPTAEQQLIDWWMGLAADEVERTVPKAVEYSSTDLADIGHQLARTAGRTVDDEEAAELGIFFYLQGKLSRWAGAVTQGKRPSDDTIFDIGVYCRMAQRVRHSGGWPGIDGEDDE